LEKAKEIFGELPKDVLEDPYAQRRFLEMYDYDVRTRGEEWCKEHRVDEIAAWKLIRTYI
jgi:hypothetical protein